MLSMQQILLLLLAALPYFALIVWLLITRKTAQFSFSSMFLGVLDIAVALAGGGVVLLLIVGNFPQTNSTLTNSFLIGVFAGITAAALVVGEFFRYMVLRKERNSSQDEKGALPGLSFGVGVSLGEYAFFVVMTVMNQDFKVSIDMAIMLMVDIMIQLLISFVAYELIKNNNFACFAVGGLYYLSLFLLVAFSSSTVLTIVTKVIVLGVAIGLLIAYLPSRKNRGVIEG